MEVRPGYKQTEVGVIPLDWGVVPVGKLARFTSGKGISVAALHAKSSDFPVPVYGGNGIAGYTTTAIVNAPCVVVGRVGQKCGEVYLTDGPAWITDNALYPKDIYRLFDELFLACSLKAVRLNEVKNKNDLPLVTQAILAAVKIAWPAIEEQRAIAAALSDVDALLAKLDQLIAKKRDLKQAAMQQLLTAQTRLPGFSGAWEVKPFGEVLSRVNGKAYQIQSSDYQETGDHPVVDQGKEPVIGFSDRADKVFHCPSGGVIVFGDHTCIVKFVDFDFIVGADGTQIMAGKNGQSARFHAYQLEYSGIPTTGYNRHFKFVKEREFITPTLAEQTAIATILSDMDAEIAALEARRDKTRALKQGMMQVLLTGKIRLIN